MTINILVTLSGFGGGDIEDSNAFVTEALKDNTFDPSRVNPKYGLLDDVLKRVDIALKQMKARWDAAGGNAMFCVFGNSKGGTVARTLLAKIADTRALPIESVRCVITHDSPHGGAVLPLGYQYIFNWAYQQKGMLPDHQKREIEEALLSVSGKQLLNYYLVIKQELAGSLEQSDDPAVRMTDVLARAQRMHPDAFPEDFPTVEAFDGQLRKYEDWHVTPRPDAERVKLLDYIAKFEKPGHWAGAGFNIAVAAGSLGTANITEDDLFFSINYPKKCGKYGYLEVFAPSSSCRTLLKTNNNADNSLPKGELVVDKVPIAWERGPGSLYYGYSKEKPLLIEKGIKDRVHDKAHGCEPTPKTFLQPNYSFIPTVSALDIKGASDPFCLRGLTNEQVTAQSNCDAVFYPTGSHNLSHGSWDDVIGPNGLKGAAGAYDLVRRQFVP